MMRALRSLTALCLMLCVTALSETGAQAQSDHGPPLPPGRSAELDSLRAQRGATLDVSLVTFGPGDAVFERFGHNAIVVTDRSTGQSFAYNWGMFDFREPNFIGRFLSGDTRYWLGVFHTDEMLNAYRSDNRSIRIQKLAFNNAQKGALFDYVRWNSEGENAFYRYDYYNDNCSTRVRDLLDFVLNGQLKRLLSIPGGGHSYRSETARILSSNLPAYAGIEMALGRNADATLTRWEEAFLPERLAEHISAIGVMQPGGRAVRLVQSDSTVFEAERRTMPQTPPEWALMTVLFGLLISGLCALFADASNTAARVVLCTSVAVWYLISGIVGTALLLAATVTKHTQYMGDNTTMLILSPLALVAMVAVPRALWKRERSAVAVGVATAIAILSVMGMIATLVPPYRQHSEVLLGVLIPVNLVIAVAAARLGGTARDE